MSDILLSATQADEIKLHPDYANSEYRENPFLPQIQEESRALKETLARMFSKVVVDEDSSEDASTSSFDDALSTSNGDRSEAFKKFSARISRYVKTLKKDQARVREGSLSISMLSAILSIIQKGWDQCQEASMLVEIGESEEERSLAKPILVEAEKIKDALESKV